MSDPQIDAEHPSQAEGEDPDRESDIEVQPEVGEHPSQAEGEDPDNTGPSADPLP